MSHSLHPTLPLSPLSPPPLSRFAESTLLPPIPQQEEPCDFPPNRTLSRSISQPSLFLKPQASSTKQENTVNETVRPLIVTCNLIHLLAWIYTVYLQIMSTYDILLILLLLFIHDYSIMTYYTTNIHVHTHFTHTLYSQFSLWLPLTLLCAHKYVYKLSLISKCSVKANTMQQ